MSLVVLYAFVAGLLLSMNRQINGRLSAATSPLIAAFWNHFIGATLLTVVGFGAGIINWPGAPTPPWSYLGGPLGVLSVASTAWLTFQLGATRTTLLVVTGQILSGTVLDIFTGHTPNALATILGMLLVASGVMVSKYKSDDL